MIPLESELPSAVEELQDPTTPQNVSEPATSAPSKKSLKDFAQLIKSKHPQVYDDLEDDDLARRVIKKYPVYADMVDLSEITNSVAKAISPTQLKMSTFEKEVQESLQPTSGQVQVGVPATQRLSGGLDIEISPVFDADPNTLSLEKMFDQGMIPLDDPDLSDDQLLDLLDKRISGATGIDPQGRIQLREMGVDPFLEMDRPAYAAQIRGAIRQAKSTGGNAFTVPLTQSVTQISKAYQEGGVAAAFEQAKLLGEEARRTRESIHEITPEEQERVLEARRSVSFKLGLANATLAQNEFWTNTLSLFSPLGAGSRGAAAPNLIPGASEAKEQLASNQPFLPEFYKNQSNFDAFVEVIPGTILQTSRMLAAAATGAAVSQATSLGPALGSIMGMQADTGLQNLDKPLSEQATHQLINLAMTGAGVGAGVARNVLAARRIFVPNILYIPTEASMMALGSYGAIEILNPEATFQQKLANSLVGGLLPIGFAAARGMMPKPKPKPVAEPFKPAGLLGPAKTGTAFELGETFPIYENKYPSEYKVNLSRPGENPLEFGYQPGEQIPLFDAIIGGQRARSYITKGLGNLSDSELSEAYILAGGLDHNLPTDRGDLITSILDLQSSKFPLMEATTENKMPVITKWAGVERLDTLLETPFQFGKTYRVLSEGKAWWVVEDLDNAGHRYRIGKYEPAGLAANLETVSTSLPGELVKTLVIPDFTGSKLETQPLLFPEPEAVPPPQGGGPRVGTTDRAGAIGRLDTLLQFQKSQEYKNLPSAQKKSLKAEVTQLRQEILTPSGGRNQLFVPRPQAKSHLSNLVNFTKRPEFAELPPDYQQLVKQEIADLDFLLNQNRATPEDIARQERIYQGIPETEGNSPRNLRDRAVNQVGAEGPRLLGPGRYEMPPPAGPLGAERQLGPAPRTKIIPRDDFPNVGEEIERIPISEARREVPQLRQDWAEYDSQLEAYKRTEEYGKLTWREKEQLEPDTQRIPLPKRLSETQTGKGKRSKVDPQAKERGWTVKVPKEGKSKAYSAMLAEKERLLQEQQNTPEPLEQLPQPQEPSQLARELELPPPSEAATSAQLPADGTLPINPGTNLFGVRSLVRELLSRREQKAAVREKLGNVATVQVPDPDSNPLWQMIRQLPVEELRSQLAEEGVDTGLLKSKSLLQKALYSRLAPESEARVVASPEQLRKFEASRLEKARGEEEVYVDAIQKLRREVGDPNLSVAQVKADPSKYETQLMDANLSPREQEVFGWRDSRNPAQVAEMEARLLQTLEAQADEPSWITEARNNLKGTTLNSLGGQTLYDLALVHAYDHIYKPGMKYAKFAAEVVEQLGEEYAPMVAGLWEHFTSQAAARVGSLGQAMRGVQAKMALRNLATEDLASRSPEALRAYYDALGLKAPDTLPVKGVLDGKIESKQLAMELTHLLSGMKKLGAKSPAEAQARLGEMRPEDATAKTMGLTTEEALAIKQAQVEKPPVVEMPDLTGERAVEVNVDDLVGAVDRLLVNNRAAGKLAELKAVPKEVPSKVVDAATLHPEDWLRGLDITPEALADRVSRITKANRLISTETYLAAKAELRDSLRQTNLGVSPRQLRAMAIVMAHEVENGIHNFGKAFSEKAIATFGDAARTNMYELAEDTFRYLRLYRESPVLNKLTQLPGGYQLGKVLDNIHKVSFGGVDAFRRAFSLGSRSREAREIGDLWAFKQSEISRAVDTMKLQLGVVHDWAEGFVYRKGGSLLNPANYAKSELDSKNLRLEMNYALDEGNEATLLTQLNAPAEIKVLINEMRTALAHMRDEVRRVSPNALEEVIENYFPRLWDRPGETATSESPRTGAPLVGSKSFLKQRTVDSTRVGVEELGWKLKSENFVDNFITRYEEMQKFVKMNEVLAYMKKGGMEKVVDRSQLEEIKEFYAPLNDKVSSIVNRVEKANGEVRYEDSGKVRVYPRTVADLINSHLAPSLHRFPAFRAWNAFSNFANQFQLVGYFHAALVTADAGFRLPSLVVKGPIDALQHAIHGETKATVGALREAGKALRDTIFTGSVGGVLYHGNKMYKEWYSPGSQSPKYAQRVKFAQLGGAQAKMEGHFQTKAIEGIIKNIQNVTELLRETDPEVGKLFGTAKEVASGASKLPFAAIEAIMRPMLEEFVPRAKLGVQYYLQGYEIARLGSRANAKEVRRVSAKVEAAVSDTLGQMNYGNLHMNKIVKEAIMSVVRATGFQFGAQRTAYMPIHDTIKFMKDAATSGTRAEFTHRMAYLAGIGIGLPIMHGIAQAILTKYNTGSALMLGDDDKGEFSAEIAIKDAVAFRSGRLDQNGDPERWYIPNLGTKELYPVFGRVLEGRPKAAFHHQMEILGHKLNPGVGIVSDVYHNKDFYGRYIFDPNSEKGSLAQAGDYAISQLTPFFIKNKDILEQRGITGGARFATFFGPTPAPQYINASTAEDVMMEILKEAYPKTGKSSEEYERGQQKRKYMNQWKQATLLGNEVVLDVLAEEIDSLVEKGTLTINDRKAIYKGVDKNRTQDLFARLAQQNLQDALRIFESWMSPEEQALVLPEIARSYRKVRNLPLSPERKQQLYDRINLILEAKQATISGLLDEEDEDVGTGASPSPVSPSPQP